MCVLKITKMYIYCSLSAAKLAWNTEKTQMEIGQV